MILDILLVQYLNYASFEKNENIWNSKEIGTDFLQSCNRRHFTKMAYEFSKLRKT